MRGEGLEQLIHKSGIKAPCARQIYQPEAYTDILIVWYVAREIGSCV